MLKITFIVILIIVYLFICILYHKNEHYTNQNVQQTQITYNWKLITPQNNYNLTNWTSITCDSTGKFVAVICADMIYANVYISTNGGNSWTNTITNQVGSHNFYNVCSSQNASVTSNNSYNWFIACGAVRDLIFTSIDAGNTWVKPNKNITGEGFWYSIACSNDGKTIVTAKNNPTSNTNDIYASYDGGSSYSNIYNQNASWTSIALNSTGTILITCAMNNYLYIANNSSNKWTFNKVSSLGIKKWNKVAMNSNGTILVACTSDGLIYISVNSGSSWNNINIFENNASNKVITSVCINSSATINNNTIAICVSNDYIYASNNLFKTWTQNSSIGNWSCITCNATGNILYATQNGGNIYVGTL